MIRLIISDIDGTLLPEGTTDLNPEYMEVISRLGDAGIQFAAASGRHASSIDAVFQPIRDQIYYISDNGAYIKKYGKEERALYLPEEKTRELLYEARKLKDCYVLFSTVDGFYTDAEDPAFAELVFGQYKGSGSTVEDLEPYVGKSIKMSIYCIHGAEMIYQDIFDRWSDTFSVNISGERWVDINSKEATKGNAAAWMQQKMHVTPEETVVFGDNYNDMSMMAQAKYSFASELSRPEVKKAARFQVASWEVDGVLNCLKQILEDQTAFLHELEMKSSEEQHEDGE